MPLPCRVAGWYEPYPFAPGVAGVTSGSAAADGEWAGGGAGALCSGAAPSFSTALRSIWRDDARRCMPARDVRWRLFSSALSRVGTTLRSGDAPSAHARVHPGAWQAQTPGCMWGSSEGSRTHRSFLPGAAWWRIRNRSGGGVRVERLRRRGVLAGGHVFLSRTEDSR